MRSSYLPFILHFGKTSACHVCRMQANDNMDGMPPQIMTTEVCGQFLIQLGSVQYLQGQNTTPLSNPLDHLYISTMPVISLYLDIANCLGATWGTLAGLTLHYHHTALPPGTQQLVWVICFCLLRGSRDKEAEPKL